MKNLNQFKGFMKEIVKDEIHDDIQANYYPEEKDIYEGTVRINFLEIDYMVYEQFDEEGEYQDTFVEITNVTDYDPEEMLNKNGIEYSRSEQSNSFYIQINGEEHRVSDHKRPAVVDGFIAYDHEYENEHIVENGMEIYWKIKELIK